jgi:hypothetical protein
MMKCDLCEKYQMQDKHFSGENDAHLVQRIFFPDIKTCQCCNDIIEKGIRYDDALGNSNGCCGNGMNVSISGNGYGDGNGDGSCGYGDGDGDGNGDGMNVSISGNGYGDGNCGYGYSDYYGYENSINL